MKNYSSGTRAIRTGEKIILHSIQLIHKNGFEAFTFKKLAIDSGTTEAGIYRYFENKHRLLIILLPGIGAGLNTRLLSRPTISKTRLLSSRK